MSTTRTAALAAGGVLALAGAAALGWWAAAPDDAPGAGALWSELTGERATSAYAVVADVPRDLLPEWVGDVGTDVVVVQPGDASDGVRPDAVRVDMAVDPGTELPDSCTDEPAGTPWDGGGAWPDLDEVSVCGEWSAALLADRLYAWRG